MTQLIHAKTALLPNGWAENVRVSVVDGRIAAVETGVSGPGVDCLLPAIVNLHSHAFQRAMAGLSERKGHGQDNFWTWRDLMYRFLDRLSPEDVEAIAGMVQMEMAEAGYAAVAEFHYLHHAQNGQTYADLAEMSVRIAAAATETGLGLTHLPVLYERGGCDGRALTRGQLRFGNDPDRFAQLWEGAARALAHLPGDTVLGVAPHSLRAASAQGLALASALDRRTPAHIHVAEQPAEVAEVLAATGQRPVEWMLANTDLSARWCLIHATQMTPDETTGLAKSGAVVGLCPITECNLGDGVFDGVRYLGAGGAFGVGSDSNVRISLVEELRTLEYSQRLAQKGRAMMAELEKSTGRLLYEQACKGGALAGGRASGAIQVGNWADLLGLDLSAPDLEGVAGDTILDAWIFAQGDGAVRDLWSAGRHIVKDGRHFSRDAIITRYRAAMRGLRAGL